MRMRRTLTGGLTSLLVLVCVQLKAEEDDRLSLSAPGQVMGLKPQPDVLIDGMLQPLSGSVCLSQTDLVAQGAEPITLTRYFASPALPVEYDLEPFDDQVKSYSHSPNLGGWSFLGHLVLSYCGNGQVRIAEPNGLTLAFSSDPYNRTSSLVGDSRGLHNVGADGPTGRCDMRNTSVEILGGGDQVVVTSPEGVRREYGMPTRVPARSCRLLYREVLPNGKCLRYHYGDNNNLTEITSHDLQERFTYAHLKQESRPDHYLFTSHTGLQAIYSLEVRQNDLTSTFRTRRLTEERIAHRRSRPLLVGVQSPTYRAEALTYSERFLLETLRGKERDYRYHYFPSAMWTLESVEAPVGEAGGYATIYELTSQGKAHGSSRVTYPDGAFDVYSRSSQGLVTSIGRHDPEGELQFEERFVWIEKSCTKDDSLQRNWLAAHAIEDAQHRLLSKTEYTYDRFGNPIKEIFSGDLAGKGGYESLTIQRQFATDGSHLLLEEAHENGLIKRYTYLPGTQLITSELICDGSQPLQRHFWEYDDCCNLIREIVDDGCGTISEDTAGVHECRITTYRLRQEEPFLHMRDWVEESYVQNGVEHPLQKIQLHYDQWGNICQEDAYNANGEFAFSIFKEFDEQGNPLSETNPVGEKATYTYDPHGRLLSAIDFAGTTTKCAYDAAGRLVEKRIRGFDGLDEGTAYEYNRRSRCICETNHLGHKTHYEYDPVSQKVVKTTKPPICSSSGHIQEVITSCRLDPFGREVALTDACGNTTSQSFNAYGSLSWVEHPDGAIDQYRYDKRGKRTSETDPQGVEIRYVRDVLDRVTLKTWHSPSGEELARETFSYQGYRLVEKSDKEGTITRYSYDGAGRQTQEDTCGRTTRFAYDSLGRLQQIERLNGDQTLVVTYVRDLLGRVLQEVKQDSIGKVLSKVSHTYDFQDNINSTTHWITPTNRATERWEYDSRGRQTAHTDELGHVTRTLYSEGYQDRVTGLYVRSATTTYPSARSVERVYDPYDRVVAIVERNGSRATLSAQALIYDPNGNLVEHRDPIHEGTQHVITHRWKYDSRDRKIEQVEAALSSDERVTRYHYFPTGELLSKELPGGVSCHYAYDGLGCLRSLTSTGSSQNVAYTYTRNRLGQLLQVIDQVTGQATDRTLDPFGNILNESLGNGFTITKTYDAFDRPLSIVYPDKSRVVYEYDPAFLREVKRYNPEGGLLYSHSYPNYNLRGELEEEVLMGTLGKICHTYDEKGRRVAIRSDHLTQTIEKHDLEGSPVLIRERDETWNLSYDGLSQLTAEESEVASHAYSYDSNYNRLTKDGEQEQHNDLNQLQQQGKLTFEYDLQGRLVRRSSSKETASYTYDALDRLISFSRGGIDVTFTYDPLGRRLSKHVHDSNAWIWKDQEERYFYDQDTELGATDERGRVTQARVLGLKTMRDIGSAVGIELKGTVYAPCHDLQGSVRALIDPYTGTKRETRYTAFGEDLPPKSAMDNPWRYLSKRWDRETGLILFGKRYYDPTLGRWLTRDPAGFAQSMSLYNYCLNNPWCWVDPDGQFVFVPVLIAIAEKSLELALAAAVAYYGEKLVEKDLRKQREKNARREAKKAANPTPYRGYPLALPQYDYNDIFTTQYLMQQARDSSAAKKESKGAYSPDRPLPRDEKSGEPKPDTDAPHTQLGKRDGDKGPYRQTREWGQGGKEVKRTDWTDHGYPENHPNPHDHVRRPNTTGGTPQGGGAEPFKMFR